MKHALPNLGNLRVFESAARHLSFSEAAKELCITKGAVSYQIRKLESDIGTTLFKRSVRQVYLTESGQELYQSTRKVFAELSGTLERLQPGSSETVSIAVTTYVASRWLSPMVTGFCEKNPDLVLQFQHTVNSSAFDLNNVDIAIRWGRCDGKLDQARLMEIPMSLFPVCSPNLFNQLAETAGPEKFSSVVLLSEDREQDLWLEWAGTRYHLNDNVQRVIPDANVRVQAAIDGQGMVLADNLMQSEISSGSLVVTAVEELGGYGYVVMSTAIARKKKQVQELLDWVTENRQQPT